MNDNKQLKYFFSAIKNDNLEKFIDLVNKNPEFLNYKNNKRESFIFYAFENESKKIINYSLQKNYNLINEKNILNLNVIHNLVIKNKNTSEYFNWIKEQDLIEAYKRTDPQGNNIILLSARTGKIETLKEILKRKPKEISIEKDNAYGQNMAHLLAINTNEDFSNLEITENMLNKLDNINGFSPLMLAAYYQKSENFINWYKKSPYNQKSFIKNSLMHFAAENKDEKVIKYLLDENCISFEENSILQTPITISINRNNINKVKLLYSYVIKNNIKVEKTDIINSPKISIKDRGLFINIIKNFNSDELDENENLTFLDNLFTFSDIDTIKTVIKEKKINNFINKENLIRFLNKSIIGKRDMILKTNYLLQDTQEIEKKDFIEIINLIRKIPSNQIVYLIKNTDLLKKTKEEHNILFIALFLEKHVNYTGLNIKFKNNEDNEIQKQIKLSMKKTDPGKILENTEHLELWLNIIKERSSVLKKYGDMIAQYKNPFEFINKNFSFLEKEIKKNLIYYTITALFKNEYEINDDAQDLIKKYDNLLFDVFYGVIKAGKIPVNKKMINLINTNLSDKFNEGDLTNLLEKNKNSKTLINFLKSNINIFKFSKLQNIKTYELIIENENHKEILSKIISKVENKSDFLVEYIKVIIRKNINSEINISKATMKNLTEENKIQLIKEIALNPKFENKEIIDTIINSVSNRHAELDVLKQGLIEDGNYIGLNKINKDKICSFNFSSIDWLNINNNVALKIDDGFFDFIKQNSSYFSNNDMDKILLSFLNYIKNNNYVFETASSLLNCLEEKISKINDTLLLDITEEISQKYNNNNDIFRFLHKNNFDDIFENVYKNKDVSFYKVLVNSKYFESLNQNIKIKIDKDILNSEMKSNKIVKKNKI